eukprot:gene14387-biopygen1918
MRRGLAPTNSASGMPMEKTDKSRGIGGRGRFHLGIGGPHNHPDQVLQVELWAFERSTLPTPNRRFDTTVEKAEHFFPGQFKALEYTVGSRGKFSE